jgi:beta-mannosidase
MAEVFAEWRRPGSSCAGGLVWLLQDCEPGAGWGLIDALGRPKPCWHALRRVLQPRQVLITDEGVNGLALHVLNETPEPLRAELRLAAFAAEPGPVLDVRRPVELAPRAALSLPAFDLLGRFFDLNHAYRFGPRAHEAVLAQLLDIDNDVISESWRFLASHRPGDGAVSADLAEAADGWTLTLTAERLQPYVHLVHAGFRPDDDGFALFPGEPKRIRLSGGRDQPAGRPEGEVLALAGRLLGAYG